MRKKRQKLFRGHSAAVDSGLQQSFTLIELLVVIAIIAILAAMLLPALKNARELSKMTVCQNNQKQIGLANDAYITDYNGFYPYGLQDPPSLATGMSKGDSPFFQYFALYKIPGNTFQCMCDPKNQTWDYYWGENCNYGPNEPDHNNFWNSIKFNSRPSSDKKACSYGFNHNIILRAAQVKFSGLKDTMVANPARCGILADALRVGVPWGWYYLDPVRQPTIMTDFLNWSHNKRVNFLLGDSHVESFAQIGVSSEVIMVPWDKNPTP